MRMIRDGEIAGLFMLIFGIGYSFGTFDLSNSAIGLLIQVIGAVIIVLSLKKGDSIEKTKNKEASDTGTSEI